MKIQVDVKAKKVSGSVAHDGESYLGLKGASEANFLNHLKTATNHNMGLLPPAVRWISKDKSIVVFERPAMQQLIEFLPYERNAINEKVDYRQQNLYCAYELNIPWTVYVCTFDTTYLPVVVKVFTRNSPLTAMTDKLGLLPLLNFYNNSKLCNPATKIFEGMPESLGEGINMAYNLVWNSGWNFDLQDAISLSRRSGRPFMPNEIAKTKLNDMTTAEKNAYKITSNSSGIVNMFRCWAKLPMSEVLKRDWCTPTIGAKGSQPKTGLTLDKAIQGAKAELQEDSSTQSRTFLVNIASALM